MARGLKKIVRSETPTYSESEVVPLNPVENTPQTVGDLLRAKREEFGVDLREAADYLRVRYSYLLAIEEGRVDDLPGATYALGFVRAYADYLGLDGPAIVERYKDETAELGDDVRLVFPSPLPEGKVPSGAIILIAVLALILVYVGWVLFAQQNVKVADLVPALPEQFAALLGSDETPETPPAPATEPTADAVAETEPAPAQRPPEPETAAATLTEAVPDTPAQPAPDAAATQSAAPAAPSVDDGAAAPIATAPTETAPAQPQVAEPAPPAPVAPMPAEPAVAAPVETAPAETAEAPVTDRAPETADAVPPEATAPPAAVETASDAAAAETASDAATTTDTAAPEPPQTAATETTSPDPEPVAPPAEAVVATATETPAAMPLPPKPPALASATPRQYGSENTESRVVITARIDSWVEVRDPAGDKLLTRVLRAGDSYRVPDRTGLVMETGNAGGLEIAVDGEVIPDIGPRGAVRRGVALDAESLKAASR